MDTFLQRHMSLILRTKRLCNARMGRSSRPLLFVQIMRSMWLCCVCPAVSTHVWQHALRLLGWETRSMLLAHTLGKELSFSVTRGIVSGYRTIGGFRLVQTDASVNPGNSGGPLVDDKGRFVGVVSWKAVGADVEGIAFAIPTSPALGSLSLSMGHETSESLRTAAAVLATPTSTALVVDDADSSRLHPIAQPNFLRAGRAWARQVEPYGSDSR